MTDWQDISTAPAEGLMLVSGGLWDGEVHGIDETETGPWLVDRDGYYFSGVM